MKCSDNKKTRIFAKNISDKYSKKIKNNNSFKIIASALEDLKSKYGVTSSEILSLVEQNKFEDIPLPISIFDNDELGCLEAIVKYLKEEMGLRFHEIAAILKRDDRTVWAAYSISRKKRPKRLKVINSKFMIPVSIFADRKFSVLELIAQYLKNNFGLRYSEIAALVNRDERNIWTSYKNYKNKNE